MRGDRIALLKQIFKFPFIRNTRCNFIFTCNDREPCNDTFLYYFNDRKKERNYNGVSEEKFQSLVSLSSNDAFVYFLFIILTIQRRNLSLHKFIKNCDNYAKLSLITLTTERKKRIYNSKPLPFKIER